jgi:hypothetical protein
MASAAAALLLAVAKVLDAVAKMLPAVTFAGFAIYFMKSNLAVGLGAALRSADVLVVAALGGVGWAFGKYLEYVAKRFDAADAATARRFDAVDAALRELTCAPPGAR